MPEIGDSSRDRAFMGPWPRRVVLLVLLVLAAKVAYLAWLSPYTLVEDEAHYWEWSRRLDWSYYSKGPGIAWTIAASEALAKLGGWENTEFAVRLPAALFSAIFTLAIAGLAGEVRTDASGRARASWLAAVLAMIVPVYYATGFLMTIDMPMLAMWAVAAWMGWRVLHAEPGRPVRVAWVALGGAVATGFLFKYTMLLVVPGLLLAWGAERWVHRRQGGATNPRRIEWGWALAGLGVALIGLAPVVVWNMQRGWPTVLHLLGHLGMRGGDVPIAPPDAVAPAWRPHPEWTLAFLVTQVGMVGPAIAIMAMGVRDAWRARRDASHVAAWMRLCAIVSAPVLLMYLTLSMFIEPEGNWPIAGYVTLVPLAAWRVHQRRSIGARVFAWRLAIVVAAILIPVSLRADFLARVPIFGGAWSWAGTPRRPLLPLGRVMGADVMARDAAKIVDELRARTATEPIIIAQQYGRASLLAFYLHKLGRGDIPVLCAGSWTGGRRTQYDLWPEFDLRDPKWVRRGAVVVGGERWHWQEWFDELIDHAPLEGEVKRSRKTYLGIGFRGLPVAAHSDGTDAGAGGAR